MKKEVTIKFDNAKAAEPVGAVIDGDFGGGSTGPIFSNDESVLTLHLYKLDDPDYDNYVQFDSFTRTFENGTSSDHNDGAYFVPKKEVEMLTKYNPDYAYGGEFKPSVTSIIIVRDDDDEKDVHRSVFTLTRQHSDAEHYYIGEYTSFYRDYDAWSGNITVEMLDISYSLEDGSGWSIFRTLKKI